MIWFYKRGAETVELETRVENGSGEYVAIVRRPDGTSETQRFADQTTFKRYLVDMERRMEEDSWQLTGGPTILPHGWRT